MKTVIDFPASRTTRRKTPAQTGRGATLFMHVKNATLIAHLSNPQGIAPAKSGKIAKN